MNRLAKKCLRTLQYTRVLLIVGLLAGCSPRIVESQQAIVTETSAEPQVILTFPPTSIPSAEVETPITEMTTLPPESILKFQPFEITSGSLLDTKAAGVLVTGGAPIQLVRFVPQVKVETITGIDPAASCLSTSPDGKWLACWQDSAESPAGRWLTVESASGQQQIKILLDLDLITFGDYLWLDNQRLIFPIVHDRNGPQDAYPMIVINPFTKEQVKLDSNYPDIYLSPLGPQSGMDLGYSDVVYDPSLNLVIYPSAIGRSYLVLWDRKSNSILAKIGESIGYYPLWSPDAKQFVVPLLVPKGSGKIVEEWFRVSRDGQVEQLTHFGDYFASAQMGRSWLFGWM